MSDFNDRPLVVGSILGLRTFRVDSLGRLTGYTHQEVFKPGENVGQCLRGESSWSGLIYPSLFRTYQISANFTVYDDGAVRKVAEAAGGPEKPTHRVGQADCTCGYYAYFDGGNDYHADDGEQVAAIIEGYGTATVGSRGFRSEKARLVAIVVPGAERTRFAHPAWFDRLSDKLRDQHWFPGVAPLGVGAGVASAAWAVDNGEAWLSPLFLAVALALVVSLFASFHSISRKYPSVSNLSRCHDGGKKRDHYDAVTRNYPDVPVYPSVRAALRDFPLPEPQPLTPDTVDDFWTRAAR